MKKFILSIFAMLLGIANVHADEYSFTFEAEQFSANGTVALGTVDWTLAGDSDYCGYDSQYGKGQQFGSSGSPYKTMTLSTSGISGTITEIKVNTSGASSIKGTLDVTVGGATFGEQIKLTKTATDYTFSGSASGNIVFSYTQTSSKAIYIKSITVTYTKGAGDAETLTQPTISPGSDEYMANEEVEVTIKHTDAEATIHYTTDGSEPTASSTAYSEPFTVTSTTAADITVKAIAVKEGFKNSNIAEATYTFVLPTAATPAISPESQFFQEGESVSVTITSTLEGATIRYTLDGTDPTANSSVYSAPISITKTTTVKAIAVKDGHNDSEVAEAFYSMIAPDALTATFVAAGQGYENAEEVVEEEITAGITATFGKGTNSNNAPKYYNSGTAIRCYAGNTFTIASVEGITITGIELTFGSSDGSNEITTDAGTYCDGIWTGSEQSVTFTIGGTTGQRRIAGIKVIYTQDEDVVIISSPTITGEKLFVGNMLVTITNNAEGTHIFFCDDNKNFTLYNEPFLINSTTTVYAYAMDTDNNKSEIVSETFTALTPMSIGEAKKTDKGVDVAINLNGAVVTANHGDYLFIEDPTGGINIYKSGAKYTRGTKFTDGYLIGTSSDYNNMKQINSAKFHANASETAVIEPTVVTIKQLTANYDAYEGRYIKLENVDVTGNTTIKDSEENEYKLYDRFELSLPETATNCDIEGIAALYKTTLQIYPMEISHTLSVGETNVATLFLDFPVTIPTDIEVYAVTSVGDKSAKLEQVEGVLPASTGVIVKTDEDGDKKFVYNSGKVAEIETNLLKGSVEDSYVSGAGYVVSDGDLGVGLYLTELNKDAEGKDGTTHFLNNANKAYLSVPVAVAGTRAFLFDFGTETGIDCIENIKGAENADAAVYDLAGRRVKGAQKGLYIVNGKVVIK